MQQLTQQQIVRAITAADNVQQAIDNLYRQVLRMYDDINNMVGYPVISQQTADYIYQAGAGKFGNAFLVGWIDRGLTIGDVPDWTADISGCKMTWSKKMTPDTLVQRIRFADHLDNLALTCEDVPEM